MSICVVSGTGTGVGKTVVTAALAALAASRGERVAVVKPAQTGLAAEEPGDLAEIGRLTGLADLHELARFPDPLAPATAARLGGRAAVDLRAAASRIEQLATSRDLVLVEGAGGLLVPFDEQGATIADLAGWLAAAVLVVTRPDLGTLNHTALTLEAMDRRDLRLAGVVIGAWPASPDLACRCNVDDLARLIDRPLAGALPEGCPDLAPPDFRAAAHAGLAAELGGNFTVASLNAPLNPSPHHQESP